MMNINNTNKKIKLSSAIFSLLFSIAMTLGKILYETNSLIAIRKSASELILTIGYFFSTYIITYYLMLIVFEWGSEKSIMPSNKLWHLFSSRLTKLYVWAIIVASWTPCLVAYWPGIFAYDIPYQTQVILGLRDFTSFQPPLHTWIWGGCMFIAGRLGMEASSIYAIFSMIFISVCYAELVCFINKNFSNNCVSIVCLLFLALFPVFPLMAINPTKDGLFSGVFTLFLIKLCELSVYKKINRKNILSLSVFGILSCLFRNNTIYVLSVSTIILFFILKDYRKMVLFIFIAIFVPVVAINHILYPALGVKDNEWAANDALAVPIQQVAAVVMNEVDTLSDEEVQCINEYFSIEELPNYYNPRISDPISHLLISFDNEGGVSGFIKLWLKLLPKHFNTYVDAFLAQNIGFWYPLADSFDPFIKQPYIATDIYFAEGVTSFTRETLLPAVYSFYEVIAWHYLIDTIPIVSNIFAISTPIWIILLGVCFAIINRKLDLLVVLCPILILWLNYLICPAAIFRFVYPIVAVYPIIAFMPFCTRENHIVKGDKYDTIQ